MFRKHLNIFLDWLWDRFTDLVMNQGREPNASRWQGPECQMCNGTGAARMIPGDGIPVYVHCPACNGHGRGP